MEEKRKLEKILLSDVDAAITSYGARRSGERGAVEKSALDNPPAEIKRLSAEYQQSRKAMEEAEAKMKQLGYQMDSVYSGENGYVYRLRLDHTIEPRALADFDEKTKKAKGALNELRRTYTLKLFAGAEEAKELFASLTKELAAIVR